MSKMFSEAEAITARVRWCSITGKDYEAFMRWLGFDTLYVPEFKFLEDATPMLLGDNTSARKKMDALLGPHWYALTKAYMVQEENK